MSLDDLRKIASETAPAGIEPAVVRLDSDDQEGGIISYFAADRTRTSIRLIVGAEEIGYVERANVVDQFGTGLLGYGDSGRIDLPGINRTPYALLEFACPVPGCPESPIFTVAEDPAVARYCRVHPDRQLQSVP